jgi:protein-S-isoprenylcysteine O-methyltransferase Ste14
VLNQRKNGSLTVPSSAARAFAWGGGVMFIASLAWFAYFYYAILGRRAAPRAALIPNLTFDLLLFAAFAGHHSVFAREGVKERVTRRIPVSLERSVYVWVASLLFVIVCTAWRPIPGGELYGLMSWGAWLARGVQALGLLLTARAAGVLDTLELAGIRQARGDERPAHLRIVGPYRWVRHPLYLGWMLFVFGAPQMTADRLAFAAISSAYLMIAIPWEERSLVASLGDSYREYKQKVKWRVLPYVY